MKLTSLCSICNKPLVLVNECQFGQDKRRKMKQGLLECTDCKVWGDIPKEFREAKHFGKCPKCNKPMFLSYGIKPEEIGLRQENKVVCGVMLHGDN